FTTDPVNQDLTLFAKWTAIPTFTVSFHSQGGSAVDSMTGIVDGLTITEPNAPTRSGYTFAGWYTDGSYATAWNFNMDSVNQNLTLFAKWTAIAISSPAAPSTSELQITYTVSFDSRGGSVISGISAVKAQSTINEPKEPERAGYSFEGWYTEAAYVTLWDFHSNKVTKNLTLYAKWAEISEETNFSDIVGHWANESILKAVKAGIVSGYPNGTFDPSRIVTRTEFLVMLMNALKPASEGADLTFTDAENIPAWGQQAVAQAVQTGIISGYADGTFLPNGPITRAEMALIIARALKIETEENATTSFADDNSIPVWAKGAVAALEKHGIMKGTGANQFNASSMANRAEAVTIILKLLEE
ncbi:Listeria/Bacterioides repeat-containing protein, partial [Paenibacillus algorifonticola]